MADFNSNLSDRLRLNETHDISLKSWVESANRASADFPLQNLPFASFRRRDTQEAFRGGVALGDFVIDLPALYKTGLFPEISEQLIACSEPSLNRFMAMGHKKNSAVRLILSRVFRKEETRSESKQQESLQKTLIPLNQIEYQLPCQITDYTDFYTSVYHATKVGSLFRPDNPLLPNYKWVPIGYHGRASSLAVSGIDFPRPHGQLKPPQADAPYLAPCNRLDYELEMGIFIGQGNVLGDTINLDEAESHVFGLCLFNDWSARDIQAWEYQPLGPFLAKNFISTLSPWIITYEALLPYRLAWTRAQSDPQPLAYLDSQANRESGAFDIQLSAKIETQNMRKKKIAPYELNVTNFRHSYWSVAQMVAHHSVNGCNLQPGDLFGSGTQSGPLPEEAGSLLELSNGGKTAIQLPNGEERKFLEDYDRIILTGWCEKEGYARLGFGEASACVLPART